MGSQDTGNPERVGLELERSLAALGAAGQGVLVACSGGLDSVVLAHALCGASRCPAADPGPLAIGHVHHGLRDEADADAAWVRELARNLEVAFEVRRIRPESEREGRSSRDRPTLQEAARQLRYRVLLEMADAAGLAWVATAHHADDQAETVLLRLLRGTGPDGLSGIPERAWGGRVVRPLLRVARADLRAYAQRHALVWREDASNHSTRYARNRLRHEWLPGLTRAFNPRLLRAIVDLAEAQSRDSEWIAAQVARESERRFHLEEPWLRIDAKDWATLPEALARRVAREALVRAGAGRHASRVHLTRMLAFLRNARSGTRIELPGGLLLVRERAGFRLGPMPAGRADRPTGGPEDAC